MNNKSKYNTSDYLNKWYENLFVQEYLSSNSEENPYTEPAYKCECKCGNKTIRRVRGVILGVLKSCENCSQERKRNSKYENLELMSKKYGTLTIKEFINGVDIRNTEKAPAYICECDCGNIVIKKASHIINRTIKSCGKCHETRSKYAGKSFIGQKFGKLIIRNIGHDGFQNTFICDCECGRSDNIEYPASMVYTGYRKQCSICARESSNESLNTKRYDNEYLNSLIDKKFGKLTVRNIFKGSNGNTWASCDCECGTKEHSLMVCNLVREDYGTKACGKCREAPNAKYDNTDYIRKTFNGLEVIDIKKENNKTYWLCRCNICYEHNERWFPATNVVNGNNKSCGCMVSYGEYIIEKALKSRGINYKRQVTFGGLKGIRGGTLRFDFGIYDKNDNLTGLIEYDGSQHFNDINYNYYITEFELANDINIVKENDAIKNKYCVDNKIQLVRLSGHITEDIFFEKMLTACREYKGQYITTL